VDGGKAGIGAINAAPIRCSAVERCDADLLRLAAQVEPRLDVQDGLLAGLDDDLGLVGVQHRQITRKSSGLNIRQG